MLARSATTPFEPGYGCRAEDVPDGEIPDIIGLMEQPDGWSFVCKLCGKDHEVPEEMAPYWRDAQTLAGILTQDVTLGCSECPGTAQYSFSEFRPFKIV